MDRVATILPRAAGLMVVSAAVACSMTARSPDQYREDTAALLETKRPSIRACYDTALRAMAGSQGTVTVRFKVAADTGRITDPALDPSTTAPPAVSECVLRELGAIALSPGDVREGQATFTWEFQAPKAAGPT